MSAEFEQQISTMSRNLLQWFDKMEIIYEEVPGEEPGEDYIFFKYNHIEMVTFTNLPSNQILFVVPFNFSEDKDLLRSYLPMLGETVTAVSNNCGVVDLEDGGGNLYCHWDINPRPLRKYQVENALKEMFQAFCILQHAILMSKEHSEML